MPKATSRIQHRPLNEKDQKAKDERKTYEVGETVPKDVAEDAPGAVEQSEAKVKDGDFTSDEAVRRSMTNAPDHPDRPQDIPGVDDWKVSKVGAFAGEPVVAAEEKAEAEAELRSDVDDKGKSTAPKADAKKK